MDSLKAILPLVISALLSIVAYKYFLLLKLPTFYLVLAFGLFVNHLTKRDLSIQQEKTFRNRCIRLQLEKYYPEYIPQQENVKSDLFHEGGSSLERRYWSRTYLKKVMILLADTAYLLIGLGSLLYFILK